MLLFLFAAISHAQRIKGGWIECSHSFDNLQEKTSTYAINVQVFGAGNYDVFINCFSAANGARVFRRAASPLETYFTNLTNQFSDCLNTSALNNVYNIRNISLEIAVPTSPDGYFLTVDLAPPKVPLMPIVPIGRDSTIRNIYDPVNTGILLSTNMLGTVNGIDYHKNDNPFFNFTDAVTICKNTWFSSQYSVTDADGDSLSCSFGEAIQMAFDTTSPPLSPVQYTGIYSGQEPLGPGVTINPVTGLISGISPNLPGGYNVAVYVQEWRNGILINTTRKESQIKVVNCPFQKPLLKPVYVQCRVNTFNFKTEPTCPAIIDYYWDFGDPNTLADTSLLPTPSYTYPPGTGSYTLKLKIKGANGYFDSATSVVKIVDSVAIRLRIDTAICSTDTILLNPISEGTNFRWRESGGGITLNNYNIKNVKAFPSANSTVYYVRAQLNNCFDSTQILVHASPYPKANAGADTIICLGNSIVLQGSIAGAYFTWSPIVGLMNSTTLTPTASPSKNMAYVLAVRDTFYCPKTVTDTVKIKVVANFTANAGVDANIVFGQPYQLHATTIGNTEIVRYQWSPATFLNNSSFANPYATITNTALETVRYTLTATTVVGNCSATDDVVLRLFKTGPDILVPSGFTPNSDGKNDVLKPILIGIEKLERFSVYNRFGQTVFTTTNGYEGWDGKKDGNLQTAGAYIFIAEGKTYTGKHISKKGNILLIR